MNTKAVSQTLYTTIANFIVALLINLLAWQYSLISGGLTGYALLLNQIIYIPVGVILFVSNLALIALAYLLVGRGPGLRATYGFVTLSIFLDLIRNILNLQKLPNPGFGPSLLLIVILSVVMGCAVSVVLANEYSVGAYSTIFIIVKEYVKVQAQTVFFILDFILAAVALVKYGWEAGVLLVVNAILAYYVVKFVLPRAKKIF